MILLSPPKLKHRQRNRIVQYVSIGICLINFLSITPVSTPSDVEEFRDFVVYGTSEQHSATSAPSPSSHNYEYYYNNDEQDPTLTSERGPNLPPIQLESPNTPQKKKKKKNNNNNKKTNNGNLFTNLFNQNRNKKQQQKKNKKNNNTIVTEESNTKKSEDSNTNLTFGKDDTATVSSSTFYDFETGRGGGEDVSVVASILAFSVLALLYAFITTAVSSTTSTSSRSVVQSQSMDGLESLVKRVTTASTTATAPTTTASTAMYKISVLLKYLLKAVILIIFMIIAFLWYMIGLRLHASGLFSSSSRGMITVDPGKVLQALAEHGEGTLDNNAQRILKDFVHVTSCDYAKLDIFRNRMEVTNFAITPQRHPRRTSTTISNTASTSTATSGPREGQSIVQSQQNNNQGEQLSSTSPSQEEEDLPLLEPALKIGKVILEWDFYDSKPCFNIMVEDVHYLIEYTRTTPFVPILSKSNWDELKEQGFPPEDDEEPPIQIGSLKMNGHLILRIRSRPFSTDLIKPIRIPLHNLHDLFDIISIKSKQVQEEAAIAAAAAAAAAAAEAELVAKTNQSKALPPTAPNAIPSLGGAPAEIVFPSAEDYSTFEDKRRTTGVDTTSKASYPAIRGLSLNEFTAIVEDYVKDKAIGFLTAPPKGVWNFWQQLFTSNSNSNKKQKAIKDMQPSSSLQPQIDKEETYETKSKNISIE